MPILLNANGCIANTKANVNLQVRVTVHDKHHLRYFSPVSRPQDFGRVELVLRFESQGIVSNLFKTLQPGEILVKCGVYGRYVSMEVG